MNTTKWMKRTLPPLAACTLALAVTSHAVAQESYPSQPIQLVVPWKPGGPGDTYGRMIANAINDNKLLPQPVAVINVPGGGTTIGSRDVRDADADGYRVLFQHQTLITSELMGTADYGIEAFEPIAETNNFCLVYGTAADSGIESMAGLKEQADANPGSIKDATLLGSLSHFSSEMLNSAAGIDMGYVNIGGGSARTTSLLGGHTQVAIMPPSAVTRSDGRLRALVFMGAERHPDLPDVPTAVELGYDVVSCLNYMWFAPKGTPKERVDVLTDALRKAMELPELREAMIKRGVVPEFHTGEALLTRISDSQKALKAIAANLQ